MNKLLMLFFCILALTCYTSCKKNDTARTTNTTSDSATILGFKDSTQLIKSITSLYYDTAGVITDSSNEYIFYDTINRKISIRSGASVSSPLLEGFSYNGTGLLGQVTTTYDLSQDSLGTASIAYAYDASNVLKTATIVNNSGQTYVVSLNKSLLAGGNYQLSWLDTDPAIIITDSNYYSVNFDANGRMLSYYENNGYLSDSVMYDAAGNINKVQETFYSTPFDTAGANIFTLYDLGTRDTKGDQLYNFFQVVYNGVANIPPDVAGFGPDTDQDLIYQVFKYPVISSKVNRPDGNQYCVSCGVHLVNFNNAPQYDSQNRLVRYSTFFNDEALFRMDVVLSYYK